MKQLVTANLDRLSEEIIVRTRMATGTLALLSQDPVTLARFGPRHRCATRAAQNDEDNRR